MAQNPLLRTLRRPLPHLRILLPHLPRITLIGAQLLFLGHLFHDSLLEVAPCEGASMLPTLALQDEWIVVLRPRVARIVRGWEERGILTSAADAWRALVRRASSRGGGGGGGGGEEKEDRRLESTWRDRLDPSCGLGLRLGDLVITLKPTERDKSVCKRVVGLAGDTVLLDPGDGPKGFGEEEEDWSRDIAGVGEGASAGAGWGWKDGTAKGEATYVTVPKGHIFLCGDNLSMSADSREYGPVPLGLVQGRVVARVWPSFKWFPKMLKEEGPL